MAQEVKVVTVRADSVQPGDIIQWVKDGPWGKVELVQVHPTFDLQIEGWVGTARVSQYELVRLQKEVGEE
jgi:hypothetical protein